MTMSELIQAVTTALEGVGVVTTGSDPADVAALPVSITVTLAGERSLGLTGRLLEGTLSLRAEATAEGHAAVAEVGATVRDRLEAAVQAVVPVLPGGQRMAYGGQMSARGRVSMAAEVRYYRTEG